MTYSRRLLNSWSSNYTLVWSA